MSPIKSQNSLQKRKWVKWIVIPLITLFILGGVLHYLIAFRLKDILQLVVEKETNGVYAFNAGDISVSVYQKRLVINNAVLSCNDTADIASHYSLEVPKVYLGIHSWSDLLLRQKLAIDSLYIQTPYLKTHVHTEAAGEKQKHISFHISKAASALRNLLNKLEVRSFHLRDGAFSFSSRKNPNPFSSNRINLSITNFSKKEKQPDRLLSADDFDLFTTNQVWKLPDGKHEISFSKLHFSGNRQFFELDSFAFRTINQDTNNVSMTADQLFFNSKQLSALYEKEELSIDSLILLHPVISMQQKNKPAPKSNSPGSLSKTLHDLFKEVRFKYIDIEAGQFLMQGKNNQQAASITDKTNLKIYNLAMGNGHPAGMTADSIQAKLKNVRFITKDSLFELGINDFTIRNNDIDFKDVAFYPTARNHFKNLDFKAPRLLLQGINLEGLMDKKLRAKKASLYHPLINMQGRRKVKSKTDSTVTAVAPGQGKLNNFYKAIHGLAELLAVDTLQIVNGDMEYHAPGHSPMQLSLIKINTDLLLHQFLKSDSIIDIKHSMPIFKIGMVNMRSPKLKLTITDYLFNGLVRDNYASSFNLTLPNNTNLRGKLIAWQELDWDSLLYSKRLDLDALQIHELNVNLHQNEKKKAPQTKKDLFPMVIRRLDIDNIKGTVHSANRQTIQFEGGEICMDKINAFKKSFSWDIVLGKFKNIHFNNDKMNITVNKLNIDNGHETVFENSKISITKKNGSYTKLDIPDLKIAVAIKSNNSSSFAVGSVKAEQPVISIYSKPGIDSAHTEKKKKLKIPIDLLLKNLAIRKGNIRFTKETAKDTTTATAAINIQAKDIALHKAGEKLVEYEKTQFDISSLRFLKKNQDVLLTKSSVILRHGHLNNKEKISLNSSIALEWKDADINIIKPGQSELSLQKLTSAFEDDHFSFTPGKKIQWQALLNYTSLHKGGVSFSNNTISAKAGNLSWKPFMHSLHIHSFSMIPKYHIGDTLPDGRIQPQYLSVRGNDIIANGIAFKHSETDSSLVIKKLSLNGMVLNTAKDKRIPELNTKEKWMFASLVNSIKFPFQIDSLLMQNGTVTVTETSPKTNKQGIIPLEEINAVATNIKNRNNEKDSIHIIANARLFDSYIRNLQYKESYGDSLGGFTLGVQTSPMLLTEFSKVTTPLASVRVVTGNSDTLFASWTGNKYAAFGKMDFYYKNLKVQLLDKKNPEKKKFLLSIENFLANSILLKKKNSKYAYVYFERDKQKSIFNYWVKTSMSGLLSTTGVKSNKKYLKKYNKMQDEYKLSSLSNN